MGCQRASDAEACAAFGAATGQYFTAVGGFHAGTETVVALAFQIAGLVCTLGGHDGTSIKMGCSERESIACICMARQVKQGLADGMATG